MKKTSLLLLTIVLCFSCGRKERSQENFNADALMIRMAEISIEPAYVAEYLSVLKEASKASVALEAGVIAIYPMYQKENPTEITILEVYANKKAYESHLETPHFKHYKTTTLKMITSLKLIDMNAIDGETMSKMFKKIN